MLHGRKVADNYFSGRGNRTKSGINHATTRPESLRAREVDEKGARVRGEAEGPHPPRSYSSPPFSFASAVFAPVSRRRMSTLPFPRLTQMRGRQHTFNSLLIPQLLLLRPRRPRRPRRAPFIFPVFRAPRLASDSAEDE